MKVKLSDIINAMESTDQYSQYFLDKETGRITFVSDMAMTCDEQQEIYDILDAHGFYRLPTSYDIHEYGIMEDFVNSLPAPACEYLSIAISGKGAFRRFKDTVRRLGLDGQWYEWRDNAYRRLAIDWCEDCGLEFDA